MRAMQMRHASMKGPSKDFRPNTSACKTGWTRMSTSWREEQTRCLREIEQHQAANKSYMDEGVRLLELARNARCLFERQEPREKRRLLNFLVSNCSWKSGELTATLCQPFQSSRRNDACASRRNDACARKGKGRRRFRQRPFSDLAPRAGLEPATKRLTAAQQGTI